MIDSLKRSSAFVLAGCFISLLSGCGGNDRWAWTDIPESKCASGTATGIGINPHAGSKQLMIYLEGGGSCADMTTCWIDPSAAHTSGYGRKEFLAEPKLNHYLIFKRDATSGNPFATANMVYVPYCTGDYHSGYNMQTLTGGGMSKDTYFWGGRNMDAFMKKLKTRFPDMEQVWLVGTSAGGVGTTANYYRVRDTFNVRTDVINDSGTPLGLSSAKGDALELWGTPPLPGCETCTSLEEKVASIRYENPGSRYAFLGFDYDNVVAKSYGIDLTTYNNELNKMLTDFSADANFASFTIANPKERPQHVVMGHFVHEPLNDALASWLTKMVNDEVWTSERFAP